MRLDEKNREIYPLVCNNEDLVSKIQTRFNWFSSVADSCFKGIIPKLSPHYFSSRENHMVAMAFGARLGGKYPLILMQNSGLGLSLDALLGTFELYKLGCVIFISNRGELDWEEVQHSDWGNVTIPLINAMGYNILDFQDLGLDAIDIAYGMSIVKNKIVFVLVHRGNLNENV